MSVDHGLETVSFTSMEHGTKDDYTLVFAHEQEQLDTQADRVMDWLRQMDGPSPYKISRLDHVLQSATRAEADGADTETIVCALLHDIGDIIGTANHSQVGAALLRPYVSEQNYWVVNHHGLFQGYYYFAHYDMDPDLRDRYAGHPFYDACVRFCADWDQNCFDPTYANKPLEHWEPMVQEIFARKPADVFNT
ncbi:MAG: peptidase [Ilumatobacteraceae bacterium]|nr:peptidase [Ilumatobacteraceae bacterium]